LDVLALGGARSLTLIVQAESSREERRQARKIGLLNYMKTMGLLSDDLKNLEETIEVTAYVLFLCACSRERY
jgi:hypothetical protein